MLESVTRRMIDESTDGIYRFTFYCDMCDKPWTCEPIRSVPHDIIHLHNAAASPEEKLSEHQFAYERANLEAMSHFNRCPACKRWVCDDCFRIMREGDFCSECAVENFRNIKKRRGDT